MQGGSCLLGTLAPRPGTLPLPFFLLLPQFHSQFIRSVSFLEENLLPCTWDLNRATKKISFVESTKVDAAVVKAKPPMGVPNDRGALLAGVSVGFTFEETSPTTLHGAGYISGKRREAFVK